MQVSCLIFSFTQLVVIRQGKQTTATSQENTTGRGGGVLCCNDFSVLLLFPHKWSKELPNTTTITHPVPVRTPEAECLSACACVSVFTHAAQLPDNTQSESCRSNEPSGVSRAICHASPESTFHTDTHDTHSYKCKCRSRNKGRS